MNDTTDLSELRAAVAPLPSGLRTPLAKVLIAAVRPGDRPEATVRRALASLDARILRAERQHRDDREAEPLADLIEQHPDLCCAIAAWAATWRAAA